MRHQLDALVTAYDNGTLSRRQLLQAGQIVIKAEVEIDALHLAVGHQVSAGTAGVMKPRMLHHVNLQVSDVVKSEAFYRRLFALPPSRVVQGPDNHGFDLPGGGLFILQKSANPGRIDHFCLGVEQFDADRLRTAARAAGFERVQGTAADNFFVTDPDGVRVQVSAVDWPA